LLRELPDFFGGLAVVLRSRRLCVAHHGAPRRKPHPNTKPLSLSEGSAAHSLSSVIYAAVLPPGHMFSPGCHRCGEGSRRPALHGGAWGMPSLSAPRTGLSPGMRRTLPF
jgi:hypothetical protein